MSFRPFHFLDVLIECVNEGSESTVDFFRRCIVEQGQVFVQHLARKSLTVNLRRVDAVREYRLSPSGDPPALGFSLAALLLESLGSVLGLPFKPKCFGLELLFSNLDLAFAIPQRL